MLLCSKSEYYMFLQSEHESYILPIILLNFHRYATHAETWHMTPMRHIELLHDASSPEYRHRGSSNPSMHFLLHNYCIYDQQTTDKSINCFALCNVWTENYFFVEIYTSSGHISTQDPKKLVYKLPAQNMSLKVKSKRANYINNHLIWSIKSNQWYSRKKLIWKWNFKYIYYNNTWFRM